MKTVVGFASAADYPTFAEAGADELFCGYVPFDLASELSPVNRREVRAVNTQIGSESELRILAYMVRSIGVPVTLAFNALCYTPELLERVADVIEKCVDIGFVRFIIADPALMIAIRRRGLPVSIHVSGELGEMNRAAVNLCAELGAKRIIFHRRMGIENMAACVRSHPELEYEAFALNELCHFHGGFCNTLHCDALPHICRIPYRMNGVEPETEEADPTMPGSTGCGLCALKQLEQAGITHLKLVSRGNYTDLTLRDLHILKTAVRLDETSEDSDSYRSEMKNMLFPNGCSGKCYYL